VSAHPHALARLTSSIPDRGNCEAEGELDSEEIVGVNNWHVGDG
jgi:hypothetical protein